MCYDLSESDVNEEQCSGPYYSDDVLKELDGYAYAGQCREVNSKLQKNGHRSDLIYMYNRYTKTM